MKSKFFRYVLAAFAGLLLASAPAAAQNLRISGAGASFPFPLYSAWFQKYSQITPNVRIDYQSTGSGAGVRSFVQRLVNFAGSDAAISDEEIKQVEGGVVVLPLTAGEIVLIYNLPGVPELKLPREVYPLIFAGEITRWNDPRIVEANPGVTLPDQTITVVRRSDSSGTTFVFTQHLSAISQAFKDKLGFGTTVQWPSLPNFVGAPRNDGITATVAQTPGAIGYVEYGFAKLSNTPFALLQNKSGEFVKAGDAAGQAALASADFSGEDLRIWVTDPTSPEAYPIATFTWLLFYKDNRNPAIAAALRDFVKWAATDGQTMANELGYIPLPEVVVERVIKESANIQ
ncbi:phosphate ABC transporter substrate-binding protein PstS [Pseudochelatococcus contaminans]|uniref:Phosphate-binding protein PstS n=1 Tax=Pseudochelatococcus contaminans TaxID=1538103 RepID=A0A7W6EGP5_9HYPH|nr:phosphate ABC transporter substrate-binding protein PstS [Pseudochelatococcus contaminans]MBB3809167.1 phosphate transport system substrate-binding protein [Pseudochelatococcus contaminans]